MPDRTKYRAFTATYDDIVDDIVTPAFVLSTSAPDAAPIKVTALWDTGAAGSCIKPWLKDKLGLSVFDSNNPPLLSGLGGDVRAPTTFVNIRLICDAEIRWCPVNVVDFPGDEDILIGMDIIGMGDFAVCNADGKTSFSFGMPPFPDRVDFAEKAKTANSASGKK